jgi:hypothetical protein
MEIGRIGVPRRIALLLRAAANRFCVVESVEVSLIGAIDAAGELGRVIGAPGLVPRFIDRDGGFTAYLVLAPR